MNLKRTILIVSGSTILVCAFAGTAFAENVYWTGAVDEFWSEAGNWSSAPNRPQPDDDVFHLIGGEIKMDMGTFPNPIVVNSFTADQGQLTI